ncbi:sulfurtransferase TusA family protein [Paracoccaceae bacterium]|nr:sulfurtransferase TusA family protein [Paracoccaceae bacterium]
MKKKSDYCLVIDTTGLRCPLPVLKVRKNLPNLKEKDLALIIADDPLAEIDLKHFCGIQGYEIKKISSNKSDKNQCFEIMCKSK